jgi:hypothetical protein
MQFLLLIILADIGLAGPLSCLQSQMNQKFHKKHERYIRVVFYNIILPDCFYSISEQHIASLGPLHYLQQVSFPKKIYTTF